MPPEFLALSALLRENMYFNETNGHGWTIWKQFVLVDVIPKVTLFDKRNYTKINKCVDYQKSQLRIEKQAENQTGAPAKARVKPTGLQIMRDVVLGGSSQDDLWDQLHRVSAWILYPSATYA